MSGKFPTIFGITSRSALANIVLISNATIWYAFAFSILGGLIQDTGEAIWSTHFIVATSSAMVGATLTDKNNSKSKFLVFWMSFGIISSLSLMLFNPSNQLSMLAVAAILGASFGLGLPASMSYFTNSTRIENRAKLGGLILLVEGLGAISLGIIRVEGIMLQALTLAIWRGCGLIAYLVLKPSKEHGEKRSISFASVLGQRSFALYLIPWIMFSLVNYLSIPVAEMALDSIEQLDIDVIVTIGSVISGIIAVVGGFLSDFMGRKRIIITGFIMLGLGYAVLGIFPKALLSWYFYALIDGIAWGAFSVIFIITIWGDLSYGASSDKYYALGGLPFFIANFIRLMIGSYVAETVTDLSFFSLAAFFLFLAVIPLMFAPETLPEKRIIKRELRKYVEKAKRVRQKYS